MEHQRSSLKRRRVAPLHLVEDIPAEILSEILGWAIPSPQRDALCHIMAIYCIMRSCRALCAIVGRYRIGYMQGRAFVRSNWHPHQCQLCRCSYVKGRWKVLHTPQWMLLVCCPCADHVDKLVNREAMPSLRHRKAIAESLLLSQPQCFCASSGSSSPCGICTVLPKVSDRARAYADLVRRCRSCNAQCQMYRYLRCIRCEKPYCIRHIVRATKHGYALCHKCVILLCKSVDTMK